MPQCKYPRIRNWGGILGKIQNIIIHVEKQIIPMPE